MTFGGRKTLALWWAVGALAVAYPLAAHDMKHADHAAKTTVVDVGVPGAEADVSATRTIVMKETEDGRMLFEPEVVEVKSGETVRLSFRNAGEVPHEFFMGDQASLTDHAEMMKEMPDMNHEEPNAVRLDPGKSGDIVWRFGGAGSVDFACLVPGHFEAGMRGRFVVSGK